MVKNVWHDLKLSAARRAPSARIGPSTRWNVTANCPGAGGGVEPPVGRCREVESLMRAVEAASLGQERAVRARVRDYFGIVDASHRALGGFSQFDLLSFG